MSDSSIRFNGVPLTGIVIHPKASSAERFAAAECRSYLQQAVGEEVSVVQSDRRPKGAAVLIGRRFLQEEPEVFSARDRFGPDPYVVQITDDAIFLAGRGDRGTVFAAYDFLENEIGCRWLQPSKDGDFVPQLTEIRLEPSVREERPAFVFRIAGGFKSECYVDWATKHRMQVITPSAQFPERGGSIVGTMGHAFYEFVPPEEHFEAHPEYFEMDESGDRKREKGQLCTTRPEVIELVAAGVRRYFEENPTASYVSLSPSVYLTWCRCEDCRRLDSGEVFRKAITRDTFKDFTVVSDGLWHFLNAVAERVAPEFPDKKLYCFAYNQYLYPPRKIKPHPMVMPSICHMSPANYARALDDPADEENGAFRDIVGEWRETGIDLFFYAYTRKTMWEQNPWPIARRLVGDIRYLRQNNFIGFFSQGGEQAWGQLGVNYYLMAKALWDPDCDVAAILDDYFRHTFGPASASMKRYYDTMEEAFSAPGNFVHHVAPAESQQILRPEIVAECDEAIRTAYEEASDEVIRGRIELVDLAYRYAKHFRAAHDAHARWTQAAERGDLERAVTEMAAAVSLCDENASKDALDLWLAGREKHGIRDKYLRTWESELA